MKRILVFLIPIIFLNSCQTSYFTGKKPLPWENDIVYQTISWDRNASEEDINQEFTAFIRETLRVTSYRDYILLFQSNDHIEESERTYVLKIFRNSESKNQFLRNSEDIVKLSKKLSSRDFNMRFMQLKSGIPVEEVYNLLPELSEYRATLRIYTNFSELRIADICFKFDLKGYLIAYERNSNLTKPFENGEWVF